MCVSQDYPDYRLRTPRSLPICGSKPAKVSVSWSLTESQRDPDRKAQAVLFSFELPYARALEPALGRCFEVRRQLSSESSCGVRLHCAEWSGAGVSDCRRRHTKSGRDWPDLWRCRPLVLLISL